jgi:hypothetical protein
VSKSLCEPARHGAIPGVRVADKTLGGMTCIRLAATVVVHAGTRPARSQRLSPFIEELPKAIGPLDRRLDVDDAVGGVGVQPVRTDARAMNGPCAVPSACAGMPIAAGTCRAMPFTKMAKWAWMWNSVCSPAWQTIWSTGSPVAASAAGLLCPLPGNLLPAGLLVPVALGD